MIEFVVYGYVHGTELGIDDSAFYCKDEAKLKTLKAALEWKSKFLSGNKYGACDIYRHSPNGTKKVA